MKTTVVSYEEFSDIEFNPPSRWFIIVATSDVVFFHYRSRQAAQQAADEYVGQEGKYTIRSTKLG